MKRKMKSRNVIVQLAIRTDAKVKDLVNSDMWYQNWNVFLECNDYQLTEKPKVTIVQDTKKK